MTMVLWVTEDLACWYAREDSDWVLLGDIIEHEALPMPLGFAIPRGVDPEKYVQIPGEDRFYFRLLRDDDSQMPVYEAQTSDLKRMTVMSEFIFAMTDWATELGYEVLSCKLTEIRFRQTQTQRESVLFKAGISIMAYTRGFQVVFEQLINRNT